MSKKPNIKQVDWTPFEKRPTWSYVTSRELAKVFGCSLQSINNWRMRELLPEPDFSPHLNGNKNHYKISSIRAWLEERKEEDIHWDWIKEHTDDIKNFPNLKSAIETIALCWEEYDVEKSKAIDSPNSPNPYFEPWWQEA